MCEGGNSNVYWALRSALLVLVLKNSNPETDGTSEVTKLKARRNTGKYCLSEPNEERTGEEYALALDVRHPRAWTKKKIILRFHHPHQHLSIYNESPRGERRHITFFSPTLQRLANDSKII
jgi:hypothetical protein